MKQDKYNPTIYIDMDGVLADFETPTIEVLGPGFKYELKDLSGWEKLYAAKPDLYLELELMPNAKKLWQAMKSTGLQIQILTAIPRRFYWLNAAKHKLQWVHKHFGEEVLVNFGPYSGDKHLFCRREVQDILIDDLDLNIKDWTAAGGLGILYKDASLV